MKKFLLILFTLFYFASTAGVSVKVHYCGGKLKSVSFFARNNEKSCCGTKKMKRNNCCKDKLAVIKINDTQQHTKLFYVSDNSDKPLSAGTYELLFHNYNLPVVINAKEIHSPPVFYDNPLYLQYKVLLI